MKEDEFIMNEMVASNVTHQESGSSIQTTIAEINLVPTIQETTAFQAILQEIPLRVDEANQLLLHYRTDPDSFIEQFDDATLDTHLKQMEHVSGFVRDIEDARKKMKQYMNSVRDQVMENLDARLQGAQFYELARAQADIKQLKKDVDADRRARRWEEIRATFEANINRYPLLGEIAPELADFSRFKLLFPKLISGAKTRKVTEADHKMVNETVYAWNTAAELIRNNQWQLSPQGLMQLIALFKQNPSIDLVQKEGLQIKTNEDQAEKARIEAEQRRLEQEQAARIAAQQREAEMARIQEQERVARLAQDQAAQARAEQERLALEERSRQAAEQEQRRRQEYTQFGGQYKTIFKESFPQFIEYLFNNPSYHDVHSNPTTKANIVYDIMHQIDHPQSVVTRETGRNPQRVLDLVRYILDA